MKDQSLYDKLISKVRQEESGCWIWTGPWHKNRPWAQNRYGYTTAKVNGKTRHLDAHRAMMFAIQGPLTREQCVCHRCDVPLCINPNHLFIGTMKENIWDSRRKLRHYESKRDYCERGHPLFGDNLYLAKNGSRHCKACQRGRQRVAKGWPENDAYSMPAQPLGYISNPARASHSAGESK